MSHQLTPSAETGEKQRHAVIVGAGIAGLSTAYWLCETGWRVTILECSSAVQPGGHIVHLFGPGRETLKRMHGVKDLAETKLWPSDTVLRDSRGRELARTSYKELYEDIQEVATRRGDLEVAIAKALPPSATIRFDARVDSVRDDTGNASVELEGGEVLEGDLLVGADGLMSMVRKAYWGKHETCTEGLGYYYATYEVDVEHGLPDYCQSYTAAGHLDVLFAPRKDNAVALHIWRADLAGQRPTDSQKYDIIRSAMAKKTNPDIVRIMAAAEKAGQVPRVSAADMVVVNSWSKGRVALLGDSAHCLSIFSSQGAGMALASAEILSEELSEGVDVVEALKKWEGRVRPSIKRLQEWTRGAAPKVVPKGKLQAWSRSLFTRALGDDIFGALQANGIQREAELVQLDERKAAISAVMDFLERDDVKDALAKMKAVEKEDEVRGKSGQGSEVK